MGIRHRPEWDEARRRSGKKLRNRPLRRIMFRLAATLGMTVGELSERMTAAELAEWIALIPIDPWGPYRADLHGAMAAWAGVAPWSKQAKVSDFLIREPEQDRKPATIDEARSFLAALGGRKHGPNG